MSANKVFTGPDVVEKLQGAVAPGWLVEAGPSDGEISFLFALPRPECMVRTCDPISPFVYAGVRGQDQQYCMEVDLIRADNGGAQASQFRLIAKEPVPGALLPALEEASSRLVDIWQ